VAPFPLSRGGLLKRFWEGFFGGSFPPGFWAFFGGALSSENVLGFQQLFAPPKVVWSQNLRDFPRFVLKFPRGDNSPIGAGFLAPVGTRDEIFLGILGRFFGV